MSIKRKIGLFSLVFTAVFLLQFAFLSFNNHSGVVDAATPKVEYLGKVSYSHYTVGKFKVNGHIAFCVDHVKPTPATGSIYSQGSVYSNESIRAILYYGYGGDGNIVGDSDAAFVATTMALDSIMNDNHTSGRSTIPGYDKLMEHAAKKDAPSTASSFSETKASTSISGNQQKSETIKFNADSRNSINLKVPSGVTLHKGGKDYKNQTVSVKGGESFYFTAGLDYEKDVTFSNVKPSLGAYQSILYIPQNSSLQRLGQGLLTDPQPLKSLTVDFELRQKKITVQHIDKHTDKLLDSSSYTRNIGSSYSFTPKNSITNGGDKYLPVDKKSKSGTLGDKDITIKFYYNLERTIKVNHIDARDNRLITTESHKVLRGGKYSYGPKTNLKKDDYTYRPISTNKESGTVGAKNITLDFYYDVPLIKAGLEKIQIYTAPASEGLPVKVKLSKENIYPNSVADMTSAKLDISLYQGSTLMDRKSFTAKTLPKELEMKIASNHLKKDTNKPYTVKIDGFNKNDIDVIKDAATLTTEGYTSSEEMINVHSANSSEVVYKGVVMTEREVRKEMKTYYETLNVPVKKIDNMRTGYGFTMPLDIKYVNEIGTNKTDFSFNMEVPFELVDKDYIEYPVNQNMAIVDLEETVNNTNTINNKTKSEQKFELQHVNVEKRTGALFSDDQVKNRDQRIKYDLLDGDRKFYLPIWSYIGEYPLSVESNKEIGVNKLNFKINHSLNIYAHMYAHLDSETKENDVIILEPVNADDPFPYGVPDSWSDSDVKKLYKILSEDMKKGNLEWPSLFSKS